MSNALMRIEEAIGHYRPKLINVLPRSEWSLPEKEGGGMFLKVTRFTHMGYGGKGELWVHAEDPKNSFKVGEFGDSVGRFEVADTSLNVSLPT